MISHNELDANLTNSNDFFAHIKLQIFTLDHDIDRFSGFLVTIWFSLLWLTRWCWCLFLLTSLLLLLFQLSVFLLSLFLLFRFLLLLLSFSATASNHPELFDRQQHKECHPVDEILQLFCDGNDIPENQTRTYSFIPNLRLIRSYYWSRSGE